jgi:hypothetical protein
VERAPEEGAVGPLWGRAQVILNKIWMQDKICILVGTFLG